MTERIYSTDAYAAVMTAGVVAADTDDGRVLLDRTVFYPGGGGQPVDQGALWVGDDRLEVVRVTQDSDGVWHWLDGALPPVGTPVEGRIDWERRYLLMRTHTSMHALCGVVWDWFRSPVTGGNMEPLRARMDFEFGPLPEGFGAEVAELVNAEITADRPVEVSFWPRAEALADEDLIRTKVNLIPESVTEIRVVDIVGLDRQADGGTHVASTAEVGRFEVTKTESKGKANKRLRIALSDA